MSCEKERRNGRSDKLTEMSRVDSLFAVVVRLQVEMGSEGVWRGGNAARAIGSHMEARYSFVQQVRSPAANLNACRTFFRALIFSFKRWD